MAMGAKFPRHRTAIAAAGLILLLAVAAGGQQLPTGSREGSSGQPRPAFGPEIDGVFFPDAFEAAGPGEPGLVRAKPGSAEMTSTETTASGADEASTWKSLVSRGTLEDEVKGLGPALTAATVSAGQFKSRGYRTARQDFSLLAVLFGVIAQHDDEVRWQADAAGLRELFARAAASSRVGSDQTFTEAQARSRDLADLIRGSSVAVPTANAELESGWQSVADRPPLMARMEVGLRERISPWVAQQAEFETQQRRLLHEAQLLAVLARVIQDESYEFADDELYQGYLQELQQASRALIEAIEREQLDEAQRAAAAIGQSCDDCHGDFRG